MFDRKMCEIKYELEEQVKDGERKLVDEERKVEELQMRMEEMQKDNELTRQQAEHAACEIHDYKVTIDNLER